ncbi:MAG TPA: hypothetical protein VGN96_00140 [Roseococcus sp.]|jgi:hypothetical protein|nr:hypothetical protein [Roseococcus sp.]
MRKIITALSLMGLLGVAACTDAYGRPDPAATALLGAGVGAAAGLAIGAASQPRYHAPPPRYYAPVRPVYRGYYGPPRGYYHHRPRGYYRW